MHFKQPRVSAVNRMPTRTFTTEKKYNNNKADSFFRLSFNVYINVDTKERAGEREINEQRRPVSLEEKRKHFIAVVKK